MHESAGDVPTADRDPEKSGIYVLVDDGPLEAWMYQFVATVDL